MLASRQGGCVNILNNDNINEDELFEEAIEVFKEIKDPRQKRKTNHNLVEVLFIIVSAMLTGANSLTGIMIFMEERASWLFHRLSLKNGLPSRPTLWRIVQVINPRNLEEAFAKLFKRFFSSYQGQICLDGKMPTVFSNPEGSALNVVSAWATELGVVLAQKTCEAKSNEIPAARDILQLLNIKGCTVTADALHCQRETAEEIHAKGGIYLLALKGNQGTLHDEAKALFELIPSNPTAYEFHEENDKGHGRVENRKIWVYRDLRWLKGKERWAGLEALIMVEAKRIASSGKSATQVDKRWYLTSSKESVEKLLHQIRTHGSIENQCHWSLDIVFDEDRAQGRDRSFASNMAAVRRFCLSVLRLDDNKKIGLKHRRTRAAMNPDYLEHLWKLFLGRKL